MVFIFKVQTWNFVCGIRMSFAFTMENILSVWYTATPGWTSKFGKVWKTRCQNAATRTKIWRCFLVSWDDKYSWVMVSNNRHELYFCSKLLCFSSIHCFFSCDQAALWMVFSVRLSVCPSVCLSVCPSVCPSVTPFSLCSHHRIIMKFSGVIT